MSQAIYVNGPAFWCVGTGVSNALAFLGVCEGETRITFSMEEEDIKTDISGGVPFDVANMGEQAKISGDLVRYDEAQLLFLQSRFPNVGGLTGNQVAGTTPAGGIGSLYSLEGNAIRFLVYAPYHGKTVFSAMVAGYNFPVAWMAGSIDTSVSTRVKKQRVIMRAIPQWTVTSTGASAVLWNQTISGLPSFS
jgi:hypothetical protein